MKFNLMARESSNTIHRLYCGEVAGYYVMLLGRTIIVMLGDHRLVRRSTIPSLRPGALDHGPVAIRYWRSSCGRIIGLATEIHDARYFGFALNLDEPILSEWGFFPPDH